MIFFTADLHLGHENIMKQCQRPFRIVEQKLYCFTIRFWNGRTRGKTVFICMGHIHNNRKLTEKVKGIKGRCMNVGVDVNDYFPVSMEIVI